MNITRPQCTLSPLINNIPGNTYEEKLAYCSSCECCERHSIDRPSILAPWVDTIKNHDYDDDDFRCNCTCRHIARMICRECTHMPTIPINEPIYSTGITEDAL